MPLACCLATVLAVGLTSCEKIEEDGDLAIGTSTSRSYPFDDYVTVYIDGKSAGTLHITPGDDYDPYCGAGIDINSRTMNVPLSVGKHTYRVSSGSRNLSSGDVTIKSGQCLLFTLQF